MVSSSPRRRRPESAARAPRVVAHPRVSELAFRRDGTTGFPGGRRDGAIRTASDARGMGEARKAALSGSMARATMSFMVLLQCCVRECLHVDGARDQFARVDC